MMEFIRNWVMSVVAVGMLVSLCLGLSPGGKVQKVGRFCGGLLLFLAVVTPLTQLDLTGSLQDFRDYCDQLSVTSDEVTQAGATLTQDLVISQSEARIQAQAKSLGADVTATVTCASQDGLPVPDGVSVTGAMTAWQRQQLTQWIMDSFGLTREQIAITAEKAEESK
ncbi:MAG: hypothetical protein SO073_04130 [Candidatus Onthomonas sp.]|nr:hypothetical protein [Candidatus Onthomonas sp.]